MQQVGLQFTVKLPGETDEQYPLELQREEIPLFLARQKGDAYMRSVAIPNNTIIVTADTIVWINNHALGKPADRQEAMEMMEMLSGNMHHVYTGVCITSNHKQHTFFAESKVFFRKLTAEEITFYVDHYHPYDKAGAYGIQEWIGFVGIEKIEGCYYNVVGLPIEKLYGELCRFVSNEQSP